MRIALAVFELVYKNVCSINLLVDIYLFYRWKVKCTGPIERVTQFWSSQNSLWRFLASDFEQSERAIAEIRL